MNSKDCRLTRREIDQTEVNQRLSDQALTHMAVCAPCREFHAERSRLRELVGSLEPVAAPADFDVRLRARLAAERQSSSRASFSSRFAVSTPALVVATLVVMLVASVVWFTQRNRNQSPTIAASESASASETNTQTGGKSSASGNDTNPSVAVTIPTAVASGANELVNRSGSPSPRDTDRTQPLSLAKGKTQSRDLAVEPAMTIKQTIDEPGEVSFSAPDKPLVVSVQDNHGATRKISLPPVSFGSQRLVDNRVPVSSPSGRVW